MRKLTTFKKLQMIIELVETGHMPLAFFLVAQFERDPVIAEFSRNDEKGYWRDREPMLTDMKAQLYKLKDE